MTDRGLRRVAGIAAAGATALVMASLVVAATAGPGDLVSRPRASLASQAPTSGLTPTLTAVPRESVAPEGVEGWDPDGLLAVLVQVITVLVIIVVLVLAAFALRAVLRRVTPYLASEAEPGFSVPEVPSAILEGADLGFDALGRGAPRNAIVAAWVALEQAAGTAGLPRHAAETSSEYVARVLRVWDVDAGSLDDLAGLYREARFSTHELTEPHRERAITALGTIRADLGRTRFTSAPMGGDAGPANPAHHGASR